MRKLVSATIATAALLAWAQPSKADIIIECQTGAQAGTGSGLSGTGTFAGCTKGAAGNPGEVILFNTALTVEGTSSIIGVTNQTGTPILFTTTNDLFDVNGAQGGGQATLTSQNGAINDLTVRIGSPPGGTFSEFVYNLDAIQNGTVQFTINALTSALVAETFTSIGFNVGTGGQNFFDFIAQNGEAITSISFTASQATIGGVEFSDNIGGVKQPRIDVNPATVTVPEPMSLALFGVGLLGLGLVSRRRNADHA